MKPISALVLATTACLLLAAPAPRIASAADDVIPVRVQVAIDKGLEWMATKQAGNGSFHHRTSVTSLAVMAFLARGHVPGQGPYGEVINRAIDYVLVNQTTSGLLSADPNAQPMYDHGISTLMLCECYGMVDENRRKKLDTAIAKAIRLILDAQRVRKSPDNAGGWRYRPTDADADISITGWQLMALRAAANNGALVPKSAIDDGIAYIRRRAAPSGGFCYTGTNGETPARTGTGVLALTLMGQLDSPAAIRGGDYLLAQRPPALNNDVFYYAAYYVSQAVYQLGGKYWSNIYPPVMEAVLRKKLQNGSWPQANGLESQGGDIYSTSMAILALAIPYRSLPIYQR